MMSAFRSPWLVLIGLLVMGSPVAAESPPTFKLVDLVGKVVGYRETLEKKWGIKLSGKQADELLALETNDGFLLPILPTTNAEFFYLDPSMHNRDVKLKVRRYEHSVMLRIIDVQTIKNGELYDAHYWCGICSIKSYAKLPCECCHEAVEFREVPTGKKVPAKE